MTTATTDADLETMVAADEAPQADMSPAYIDEALAALSNDPVGQIAYIAQYIGSANTISDETAAYLRQRAQEIARQMADRSQKDGLTGLFNRSYFDSQLEKEIERSRRARTSGERGSDHSLTLFMIDVDHFKKLNDQYGHQRGDDVLKRVAAAITGTVRSGGGVVCRYGGEEIAVISPNTTADQAALVGERIRYTVEQELADYGVTISVGAANTAAHISDHYSAEIELRLQNGRGTRHERPSWKQGKGEIASELIGKADEALYSSKHDGRNRFTLYGECAVGREGTKGTAGTKTMTASADRYVA